MVDDIGDEEVFFDSTGVKGMVHFDIQNLNLLELNYLNTFAAVVAAVIQTPNCEVMGHFHQMRTSKVKQEEKKKSSWEYFGKRVYLVNSVAV